eukprot:10842747-Alexandrium_andersonii.AAC.1
MLIGSYGLPSREHLEPEEQHRLGHLTELAPWARELAASHGVVPCGCECGFAVRVDAVLLRHGP